MLKQLSTRNEKGDELRLLFLPFWLFSWIVLEMEIITMIILPEKMLHTMTDSFSSATKSVSELPAKAADAVASAATFNLADWLIDYVTDWKQTVITWMGSMTGYGLLGVVSVWLVRKVAGRMMRPRQNATWFRWQIAGDAQSVATQLKALGRQVEYGGQGVLVVNAWDSGNVDRALQQMGIQVMK